MIVSTPMLDAALEYARRGDAVFPVWNAEAGRCGCRAYDCESPGKHPIGSCAPNGLKDATTDEATIRQWWALFPRANIATPTGVVRTVLDVDPGKGGDESLAQLEAQHGPLPTTPRVLTGGGGWHYHFAPGPGLRNSAGKVGPGLDIRGEGGYVVLPPSNHISGGAYRDDLSQPMYDTPRAAMPAWLVALALSPAAESQGNGHRRAPDEWADKLIGAPEGQRRAVALEIAGHYLGLGIACEEVEAIVVGYAARCSPPFPEREARELVRDLARRDRAKPQRNSAPDVAESDLADDEDVGADRDEGGTGTARAARGPVIDVGEQDLAHAADAAWAALTAANEPPVVFKFAGGVARVVQDDHGAIIPEPLGVDELRHRLARVADWTAERVVFGKRVIKPAHPPIAVVRDMLARPEPPLPRLVRVVEAPIFTREGTVLARPGYEAASGVLFAPAAGLEVPEVPLSPTAEDLARARRALLEELLVDFPFTGDAERAQAVAMLIEPFVRDLIVGPTPLYLIEKPTPGTGASLLAELVARIVTGRPVGAMTEGRDEDEWRKRITSKLLTGTQVLLIDNIRRRLDSAAVSSAITATVWEDRMLGQSKMIRVPVRCTWIATGNNPSLSAEMMRRAVRIRLDAKVDRPWLRRVEDFRHHDLRTWVHRTRGDLVWAALVLGQAWLAAGRSVADVRQLGMFESWSQVMGGILATAEIPGFLTNLGEFYATTDAEGAEVRAFLAAWWEKHRDAEVTAAQLFELATSPQSALDIDARTEQGRKVRFGKLLSDLRDRRYRLGEGLLVSVAQAGTFRRAVMWKLLPGESVSLCESSPCLRTRAREEFIEAEQTHRDSHTHTAEPNREGWI